MITRLHAGKICCCLLLVEKNVQEPIGGGDASGRLCWLVIINIEVLEIVLMACRYASFISSNIGPQFV